MKLPESNQMAGKKGRSGGKRTGAGRKPNPPRTSKNRALQTGDPVAFMLALMRDTKIDMKLRKDAAAELLLHERRIALRIGRREAAKTRAAELATGSRFAPMKQPGSVVPFRRRSPDDAA
jgi:hypothetical protein